ncbi:MAG: ABC transporter permease, partial [Gemmatimonadaceae bacterium]
MFDRLFHRARRPSDEEIARELRDHLELEAEATGGTGDAAAAAARRRFGNLGRAGEDVRAVWRFAWLDGPWRDARVGWRGLRRTPSFTAAVIVILALGIGMATAMFTTFRTVLVQRLPVADQSGLAVLWTERVPGVEFAPPMSILPEIRRASGTMRDLAGVAHWGTSDGAFIDGDRTLELGWAEVSANYFDVLGARPLIGRLLRPEDGAAGARPVMVLSYAAWQSRFGGNTAVIGHRVQLAYEPTDSYTIVGVAPPGLDYPVGADCWTSLADGAAVQALAVVRLAPGTGIDGARAEFLAVASRLMPSWKLTRGAGETFTSAVVGKARPILNALTVGAALLLLIACVNVANLFLVRSASRARELAVRRALGAALGTLVRQLVVESAIVAVAGGALGVAFAMALLRGLVLLAPTQLPRLDELRLHGAPVAIAIGITTACVTLFGVLPAVAATRGALMAPLRLDRRAGAGTHRGHSLQRALVASQIALALVMLVAAGLVARSLRQLEDLPLGFRPDHLAILSVAFDAARYNSREKMVQLGEAIEGRLRAVHGVAAVTPVLIPPFLGPNVWHPPSEAEGQTPDEAAANPSFPIEIANAQYFGVFGTSILRGRGFSPNDDAAAPMVVVISESVARRFWPGENALGKRLRFSPTTASPGVPIPLGLVGWRTVVGIVPDTRYRSLREA